MTLLQDKNALIFAASGAIAGGVARELGRQGARLFLSSHREGALDALLAELHGAGVEAHRATVDATDEAAVSGYLDTLEAEGREAHVAFNGIGGAPASLGYPARADEQPLADFLLPLQRIVGSQFLTAREAGRRMAQRGGGSVILLSATLSGGCFSYMAGISAACGAVEAMGRSLAGEYGPQGVRVNCVRGSGMPETRTIQQTVEGQARLRGEPMSMTPPPLGRPTSVADTARAVAFLASDLSSGMTAQRVTVCGGQFPC